MAETTEFQPNINDFNFSDITQNQAFLIIVIFFCSSLLLITCFFLHLVSRFGHFAATATASAPPTAATTPQVAVGLDADTINSMPIFLHGSLAMISAATESMEDDEERDLECSICLGKFEEEEMVKVMPECLHAYHSECLDKWLRKRSSCPLCRSSIDSNSESIAAPLNLN